MESASIFCARCERYVNFEFDRSVLETICTECGLLLESHESIEISDGRTFGNGLDNIELHRVGGPYSPFDEGFSTAISKNPDRKKGEFGWVGNQSSITECSSIEAFKTMTTVADRLKFQEMSTNNKRGILIPTQLPDDIINEIIMRLPAISNLRFKCVSKQWFSLNFEALKLKSQTHTTFGIFYGTYKDVSDGRAKYVKTEEDQNDDCCIDGTLSFLPEHRYMRIHDSCNGLLLCECEDKPILPTGALKLTSRLYVCNPAMRKWIEIPNIFMGKIQLAILDFNPLVSVHFKVIIIMSDFQVLSRNIKIFSSKTGEWSASCVMDRLIFQRIVVPMIFYEGLIFGMDRFGEAITGIDLKGKLCSRTEFPGKPYNMNNHPFSSHLFQFGGCLHSYCYGSNNEVHVWKLESGSWLLKSCFSVPFPRRHVQGIKFHPIKDDVIFLQNNDRLYSYNIKTTRAIKLCSDTLAHNYCLYSPCYLDFSGNWWKKMNA